MEWDIFSIIKAILNSGEKLTRTYWSQNSQWGPPVSPPYTRVVYNKVTNPNDWQSSGCGSSGKEFFLKWAYGDSWSGSISTVNTGCACASNGWSNMRGDSCEITWDAGCEGGPSMTHCCGCGPIVEERADIVVWIR